MKPRNIYALLARKRRAGLHRKSNKALRKLMKQQRDRSSEEEHGAFNTEVEISKFSGHTIQKHTDH